jgi:hypothetical protein
MRKKILTGGNKSKVSSDIKRNDNGDLELTGNEPINDPFPLAFRLSRMQFLSYLIRAYEAGQISTGTFISQFKASADPNHPFYKSEKNSIKNLLPNTATGVFDVQGAIKDKELDVESIDYSGTFRTRTSTEFSSLFNRAFDSIFKEIYDRTLADLNSMPDGDEKTQLINQLNALFTGKEREEFREIFRDTLLQSTRGYSYEYLISSLAREGAIHDEKIRNTPLQSWWTESRSAPASRSV